MKDKQMNAKPEIIPQGAFLYVADYLTGAQADELFVGLQKAAPWREECDWLERHYPARARKVLARIRDLRGGRLNDPQFGSRMRGEGPFAAQIEQLFEISARRAGLDRGRFALSTKSFRRAPKPQLELFAQS